MCYGSFHHRDLSCKYGATADETYTDASSVGESDFNMPYNRQSDIRPHLQVPGRAQESCCHLVGGLSH